LAISAGIVTPSNNNELAVFKQAKVGPHNDFNIKLSKPNLPRDRQQWVRATNGEDHGAHPVSGDFCMKNF